MNSEINIGQIADIIMGQSPAGETCNTNGQGLPLLNGPTEFGPKHPNPKQYTVDPKKLSNEGDLLFCVRGSTTGRMNWSDQAYAIGRGIASIRGKNGYPTSFVRAAIEYNLQNLLVQATGSTFPNVSQNLLKELKTPYVSAGNSQRIADIFNNIDDKINLLRETNTTLESIAQTIFKSWFIDFDPVRAKAEGRQPEGIDTETAALFPDSFEESEFGLIPRRWSIRHVSDFAKITKGTINPQISPETEFEHYSLPAFDDFQEPVYEKGSSIKSNKTILPQNAILLSKLNPRTPRIWLPIGYGNKSICSTEFLAFSPVEPNSKEFIYNLFCSPHFTQQLCQMVTGTSNSHQRVRPDQINNINVIVPPDSLMMHFTKITSHIFEKISINRAQIKNLKSIRDTLLPRLISGQLQLPDGLLKEDAK